MNLEFTLIKILGIGLLGAFAAGDARSFWDALVRAALLVGAVLLVCSCTSYSEGDLRFTAVGGAGTVQRVDGGGQLIVAYDNTDSFRNAMQTAGTLGAAAIWGSVQKAKYAADTAVGLAGIEGATAEALSADEVAKRMSDNDAKVAIQGLLHAE